MATVWIMMFCTKSKHTLSYVIHVVTGIQTCSIDIELYYIDVASYITLLGYGIYKY